MKRLGAFFRLGFSQQVLHIEAWFWLLSIRLILWILPYRIWRRVLLRSTSMHENFVNNAQTIECIPHAIRWMSHLVPMTTCLIQALAAQRMYLRHHRDSVLKIGVIRNEDGELVAHAWLIVGDAVVVGNLNNLESYSELDLKPSQN